MAHFFVGFKGNQNGPPRARGPLQKDPCVFVFAQESKSEQPQRVRQPIGSQRAMKESTLDSNGLVLKGIDIHWKCFLILSGGLKHWWFFNPLLPRRVRLFKGNPPDPRRRGFAMVCCVVASIFGMDQDWPSHNFEERK